jgi:hypothetical protein
MPTADQFIHRHLHPFHESFCRLCARQVAMTKEESGLIREEKNYVCDPHSVELFKEHGTDPFEFLKRLHNFPTYLYCVLTEVLTTIHQPLRVICTNCGP